MGKTIDWAAIEREYRIGRLSVFEIGRIYEVLPKDVRQTAHRLGWVREDLGEEVRGRAKAIEVAEAGVEVAASAVLTVTREHRRDIAEARTLARRLLDGLRRILSDENLAPGDVNLLSPKTGAIEGFDKYTNALVKVIALERQAFGLDDASNPNPEAVRATIEAVKSELARRNRAAAS